MYSNIIRIGVKLDANDQIQRKVSDTNRFYPLSKKIKMIVLSNPVKLSLGFYSLLTLTIS